VRRSGREGISRRGMSVRRDQLPMKFNKIEMFNQNSPLTPSPLPPPAAPPHYNKGERIHNMGTPFPPAWRRSTCGRGAGWSASLSLLLAALSCLLLQRPACWVRGARFDGIVEGLPPGFVFGTASAAYQVRGATIPGRGPSETWEPCLRPWCPS